MIGLNLAITNTLYSGIAGGETYFLTSDGKEFFTSDGKVFLVKY